MRHIPSFLDQIAVFADEDTVDLDVSSLDDVRARARLLPFEGAMSLVAEIAAKSFGLLGAQREQLEFAKLVFSDAGVMDRLRAFVQSGVEAQVFAEQHALIFERLLIEEAFDATLAEGVSPVGRAMVARNLLGCTAIVSASLERMRSETHTSAETMAVLLQSGAHNGKEMLMGEIARVVSLYGRIARHPDLLASQDKVCPIDEWMLDDYGFSIEDQIGIGFALTAMTSSLADGMDVGKTHVLSSDHVNDLILKLGFEDRRDAFLALVSADREQFRKEFADLGVGIDGIAWERRPLMRRPFLRCQNGELILLSPGAMLQWLGDGFFYRLLTSAQGRCADDPKHKLSRRFIAYTGQLLEVHALELMRSVHPDRGHPLSAVRVFGEQPYGVGGERKTSDIAVLIGGTDLVLIEVSGARMRADTLVSATGEQATADVQRMVVDKIEQLDKCITALRSSNVNRKASIPAGNPEVDMGQVQRIYPVVVTAGSISQTPPLWDLIDAKASARLRQPGVQPLTLLSIQDYEALCCLVEIGRGLNDVLARKTGPHFARRELAIWLRDDPWAPKGISGRSTYVESIWRATFEHIMGAIDFTKGRQPQTTEAEAAWRP